MKNLPTKLALIASLALSSANAAATCGDREDFLGISSVVPRVNDGVVAVQLDGKLAKSMTKGGVTVISGSVLDIPVFSSKIDVCEQAGVSCPLKAGDDISFTVAHDLPSGLPSNVELKIKIDTVDKQGEDFSCVETGLITNGEASVGDAPTGVLSVNQGLQKELGWELQHFRFLFDKWLSHFEDELPVAIEDVEHRFQVFRDNIKKIILHNLGGHSYTMGMNQFGHMTEEEFARTMLGGFRSPGKSIRGEDFSIPRETHNYEEGAALPAEVDWVKKGAVTPVKNQGACGSCWSFSTTGALEGAYFLKYGKLESFSEEQLVTCDHVDLGCNGGLMDNAFKWIAKNGGICKESDVPYVSGTGSMPACKNTCKVVKGTQIKTFRDVGHTEQSLESAVAERPVAIAIEADQGAFQFYSGGVLTQRCGTQLDHGVLAVGYGVLDGTKYWKVKNSWGPSWGQHGYINLERGLTSQQGGECGILMQASYPLL